MSNDISTEAEMSLAVVFLNEQKPRLKTFQPRAYPYYITCIINFFLKNKNPRLTTFQPMLRCRQTWVFLHIDKPRLNQCWDVDRQVFSSHRTTTSNDISTNAEMSIDMFFLHIETTTSNDISTKGEMSLDVVFLNKQKPRLTTFPSRWMHLALWSTGFDPRQRPNSARYPATDTHVVLL